MVLLVSKVARNQKFLNNTMAYIKIIPATKVEENFDVAVPAKTKLPDWYKNMLPMIGGAKNILKTDGGNNHTMKKCMPVFDAMSAGYMIVLTTDIEVIREDEGLWIKFRGDSRRLISTHNDEQWRGFVPPVGYDPHVFKFDSQNIFKTPKGYSSLVINPINRFDLETMSLGGIIDTDKYPLAISFPFFIKEGFSGVIESGTPIAQIIPIKRKNWSRVSKKKSDTDKFIANHEKLLAKISNGYKKLWRQAKEYN
jgi:hypothetical protein